MAAEPSGDLQGGALARALKARDPGLRLVGADGRVSPLAARAFDHFG